MHAGGLGWGCATYTPLDEDSYNKHSVMQAKAEFIHTDGNLKLASDMLQRCVTYFDTLGPHWLGSARRATATMRLGMCEAELAGPSNTGHMSFLGTGRPNDPAVLEPYLTKAKRIAIRELGPEHRTTLEMMTGVSARSCIMRALWLACVHTHRGTHLHTGTHTHVQTHTWLWARRSGLCSHTHTLRLPGCIALYSFPYARTHMLVHTCSYKHAHTNMLIHLA